MRSNTQAVIGVLFSLKNKASCRTDLVSGHIKQKDSRYFRIQPLAGCLQTIDITVLH